MAIVLDEPENNRKSKQKKLVRKRKLLHEKVEVIHLTALLLVVFFLTVWEFLGFSFSFQGFTNFLSACVYHCCCCFFKERDRFLCHLSNTNKLCGLFGFRV